MKVKAESLMNLALCRPTAVVLWILLWGLAFLPLSAHSQSCETSSELEDAMRTSITSAGQRYFDMAAKGDVASLKQNAIPTLAADFSAVEATVKDHQKDFAGAQGTVKSVFLLEVEGAAPAPHAEFYCGVFGKNGQTSGSAVFEFDNLPPGKYAVVLFDATSPQGRSMFSVILQRTGAEWKLGDLYIKPAQVAGHDGDWFLARAREYKTKGQTHNAWFSYLVARNLISPLARMSTLATDKLYDESQSVRPADLPFDGKTVDLVAGTSTYKVTTIFPQVVGSDLDLIVKYQAADISNTNQAYQNDVAVIKAVVTKYPEVREAFAAVVARAVDPTGRDYGAMLPMKEIK
jgi:hypothetical protein